MLESGLCKYDEFSEPWMNYWVDQIGCLTQPGARRKHWEYASVMQCLSERGMLKQGKMGIGFGVGDEGLCQVFAQRRAFVVLSDYGDKSYAHKIHELDISNDAQEYNYFWTFKTIDMNHIPKAYEGTFDFTWSVSSLEHCGNERLGMDFIINSAKCLKPGGWACHTTEFNVNPNLVDPANETARADTACVLYGKDAIENLALRLKTEANTTLLPRNYDNGTHELDKYINEPPHLSALVEAAN